MLVFSRVLHEVKKTIRQIGIRCGLHAGIEGEEGFPAFDSEREKGNPVVQVEAVLGIQFSEEFIRADGRIHESGQLAVDRIEEGADSQVALRLQIEGADDRNRKIACSGGKSRIELVPVVIAVEEVRRPE